MSANFKPDDYHTVTPYLVVKGAQELIVFITTVLGGSEMNRLPGPDDRIGHAEVRVGDSVIMLADAPSEQTWTAMLHIYVEDADRTYRKALEQGATSVREPRTEFYGDRMAGVIDKWGNQWYFATHVEDLSEAEMVRRAEQAAAQPMAG